MRPRCHVGITSSIGSRSGGVDCPIWPASFFLILSLFSCAISAHVQNEVDHITTDAAGVVYSNRIAVHVAGGHEQAKDMAARYGLNFIGQVR